MLSSIPPLPSAVQTFHLNELIYGPGAALNAIQEWSKAHTHTHFAFVRRIIIITTQNEGSGDDVYQVVVVVRSCHTCNLSEIEWRAPFTTKTAKTSCNVDTRHTKWCCWHWDMWQDRTNTTKYYANAIRGNFLPFQTRVLGSSTGSICLLLGVWRDFFFFFFFILVLMRYKGRICVWSDLNTWIIHRTICKCAE